MDESQDFVAIKNEVLNAFLGIQPEVYHILRDPSRFVLLGWIAFICKTAKMIGVLMQVYPVGYINEYKSSALDPAWNMHAVISG